MYDLSAIGIRRVCAGLATWAAVAGGCWAQEARPPEGVGASVPFVTLEAEAAANLTNGMVVRLTGLPKAEDHSPELEASGRAYVELKKVGDYLQFPNVPACNAMVIRHCIPDAPEGGGITATLGLYVNGQRRQDISLTSKYNWLYGSGKRGENGQNNTPTAFPHVFWDESRLIIAGGVKAGDTIRLQKDAGDGAEFYRIDLIDLETVPDPLPRPENSLSIADYGATGKDAATDTATIQKCINDAKALGKTVWMPPGKYLQNEFFVLDGVKVQAAGMWYTELYDTVGNAAKKWSGNSGFSFKGDGAGVSDLYIDSLATTYRTGYSPKPFFGEGSNWSIRNVWITHTGVGVWMTGQDGIVAGCRVRLTYADGININNGKVQATANIVVENNHVRGTGDDGLAILSQGHKSDSNLTRNVTLRRNTVVAPWWANNCDLAGGGGHVIEDNLFTDGMGTGFTINLPGAYRMTPLTGAVIRRNTLLRCGGNFANQRRGAIWIFPGSTSISGTVIEDNQIIEPLFRGIHIVGKMAQDIVFNRNVIDRPGEDAIVISKEAKGSGVFEGNTVRNLNPGRKEMLKEAGEEYQVITK